jgi:hypothetical protein
MRRLHEVNHILAGPAAFRDVAFLAFFDEPLSGDFLRGISDPGAKASALYALADQAEAELQTLLGLKLRSSRWLQDLELPLVQLRALAKKLALFARFQHDYPGLAQASASRVEEVLAFLAHGYAELHEGIGEAAQVLERRWLEQAKRSDLDLNLQRYDRLNRACLRRSEQFQKILAGYRTGAALPAARAVVEAEEFKEFKFDSLEEMGLKRLLAGGGS